MHNQLPIKDCTAESIWNWLNENGPASARQVQEATGHSMSQVVRAFNRGYLHRQPDLYGKTNLYVAAPGALDRKSGLGYIGAIVPSAQPKPFKPLQGYEAGLRQGRDFREISYITASNAPSVYWDNDQ